MFPSLFQTKKYADLRITKHLSHINETIIRRLLIECSLFNKVKKKEITITTKQNYVHMWKLYESL